MITINTRYGTVNMSIDAREDFIDRYKKPLSRSLRPSLEEKIAGYFEEHLFPYIFLYMVKSNYFAPRDTRILVAHGESSRDGDYVYTEKESELIKKRKVDDWLKEHDNSGHDALILLVCNEGEVNLKPRRHSFLIYPVGSVYYEDVSLAGLGFLKFNPLKIVPPQDYQNKKQIEGSQK